ncbi:hypothetical protein SBRCBS47491_009371 [Sporothrix bragantina]|uniref:Aldose 1-epimerase n=1 Tax=Sporothrix bragantina TaxID=671064 RepID=A0ABP0CU63_9PEZI
MAAPTTTSPVKFLPLGAIIQSFIIGGRDVVLGFPEQNHYQDVLHPYFGETIGRVPNRISNGKLENLNGKDYEFAKNERNITTLHGGIVGWGKKRWTGPIAVTRNKKTALLFMLHSPDGDEGFPGAVEARIWYSVSTNARDDDENSGAKEMVDLDVEYEIEMVGSEADEPDIWETVASLTNHGYWNLTDGPTVSGTEITFASNLHLQVDEDQIPTGRVLPLEGVDVEKPILFTEEGPAIDHCFVLDQDITQVPLDTRSRPLHKCVSMYHPGTKLHLVVETTEPSFQFYSGDGIDVPKVGLADGRVGVPKRVPRSGIAVEPNRYVDAVNRPEWRSLVLLKRGVVWGCRNRYRVWADDQ